jgi:glutathione peroxidase
MQAAVLLKRFKLVHAMWIAAVAFSTAAHASTPVGAPPTATSATACPDVLKVQMTPLLGEKPQSLCEYSGQVVLVVNTASQCGFTPQYEGLNTLYNRYRRQGLVIVGVPANDFGLQEPGSNKQIAQFCALNYGVSFPMYEKLNQPIAQSPLFSQLAKLSGSTPRWNFHKYLIDRTGKVTSFDPSVDPLSSPLVRQVEAALAAKR